MPAVLLGELNAEFVKCRTVGHAWDAFNPIDMPRPQYGWRLSLRCVTCGAERHDTIGNKSGTLEARAYVYPENYKLAEKVTREEFRVELKKVIKTYVDEHSMFKDLEGRNGQR